MAKLVTVVRTYIRDGYRNNTIEIDIPDEAAELIKKHWAENGGVYFNTTAKFLASNQAGICLLYKGGEEIAGIQSMSQEDTRQEEIFEYTLKMRKKTMSNLSKQQAVELVQQIFEAGFQHGVNSIFEGGPEDE